MDLILFRNEHMIKSLKNYVNGIRTAKMAPIVYEKFIFWKKMTLTSHRPLCHSILANDQIELVKAYQEVKDYFLVDHLNKKYRHMKKRNNNTHMHTYERKEKGKQKTRVCFSLRSFFSYE